MKNRFSIMCAVALISAGILTACGESPKKTLETAKFEEQQGNLDHAGKLYQQIIQQKPESPEATEAKAGMARIMEKRGGMPQ